MNYAGAPFVIEQANAAAALAIIDAAAAGNAIYTEVDIHIAQEEFDAPVQTEIGALPKIALIDTDDGVSGLGQANNGVVQLTGSIVDAEMDDLEGIVFDWVTIAQVNAGDLITNSYELAWVPSFTLAGGPSAAASTFLGNMSAFADAGGGILWQADAIEAIEGFGTYTDPTYNQSEAPTEGYMSNGGIHSDGSVSGWDNGVSGASANETTESDDYSDPASQFGGMVWTGLGGAKFAWTPRCDADYADGVRRQVYSEHLTDDTKDNYDFAAWRKKDNDPNKGTIYYLGGNNWRKNTASGFRLLMNSILAESTDVANLGNIEVSRAAPIIATVDGTFSKFVGTFEAEREITSAPTFASLADAPNFVFPHVVGHYRALDLSNPATQVSNDYAALAAAGAIQFDTADELKTMTINTAGDGCVGTPSVGADGTCRTIFTNSGTTIVPLTLGNRAALEADLGLTGAAADYMIARIHEGADDGSGGFEAALGGLDRSTAAVIEASTVLGARATIAYVGGTDGMMHAICAEDTLAPCNGKLGHELWAFMPQTELGKVKNNLARIDGTPKVADVFADYGSGTKEYKTVLTFETGNSGEAATYALDISDPVNPTILWERATTGSGTSMAMASVGVPGEGLVHLTFSQTATTGTAGMEVAAIRTATGAVLWSWTTDYGFNDPAGDNNPVRCAAGTCTPVTGDIPVSGFPGGPSVFASAGDDLIDTMMVPTLFGSVYALTTSGDGASGPAFINGSTAAAPTPLFSFSEDYHPIGSAISVYSSQSTGTLHGVAVTGGFTDLEQPSAAIWAPGDVDQYAVGFPIDAGGPIDESSGLLDFTLNFGAGNRAFSQAVIAGNEIFVTTDSGNVNAANYGTGPDSGTLFRSNLTTGASSSSTLQSGAGGVDVDPTTGTVYAGGGNDVQASAQAGFDANGTAVEVDSDGEGTRFLWLSSK
jgi:hypothetical protein